MAYILHFRRTPPPTTTTRKGPTTTSFPDLKEPCFWMAQHIGPQPTLQLPPYFQIDCWSTDAQQIQLELQDQQNTTTSKCTWTQHHIHRPSIKGRTIFWGSPKAPMNDTIDRIMFTTEIQRTLSTYPGAVMGDITLKSKPEVLLHPIHGRRGLGRHPHPVLRKPTHLE